MPVMPEKPPPVPTREARAAGARRERAWGVVIMNQLALPGFGTVMAGRKVGYAQLCLSVSGFICFTLFLFFAIPHLGELLRLRASAADDPDAALDVLSTWLPWLLLSFTGITLWVTAWLWAWTTSAKTLKSASDKS
jgi:hypothetical protein